MQLVGIIPESGEVLTHYHHMFNKTDTSCCQMKMGTVAYLGGDHHMFNKIDTTCNMSMWVWWHTWVLCRPCKWVPDVVIIFLCIASITSNIKTMQPRPFEECHIFMYRKYHVKHISKQCNLDRLVSGSKRDTNETPTCAVPMHAPQTNALW